MYPIADYKILLSLLFMPYQIKNLMKKSRDSSVNVVSVLSSHKNFVDNFQFF